MNEARELLAKAADELGYTTDARVLRSGKLGFIQVNAALRAIESALRSQGRGEDGYREAFYEIAAMLGIPARAESPKHIWETEMRPKLLATISEGM